MTRSQFLFAIANLVFLILLSTSCQREEIEELTEEDAVALIEASLQESTGGATAIVTDCTQELVSEATVNGVCNTIYRDTFDFTYDSGLVDANWIITWDYTMNCNNLSVPTTATLNSNSNGTFSTNKISSTSASSTILNATGLELSANAVSFNGLLNYGGTQQLTTAKANRSLTSDIDITLTNLTVSKTTYRITAGGATVALTGSGNQIGNFAYSGIIVFNGNGTATLTINGNIYTISL